MADTLMANVTMWLIIVVYMVVSVVAGVVSRKKDEVGNKSYFISKLPPSVIAFAVVSTSISGVGFLGAGGHGYRMGYSLFAASVIIGGGWLGNLMSILILGKPIKRVAAQMGSITLIDILTEIFKDQRLKYIAAPCILFFSTFFAAVQWTAIGYLFSLLLGIDYKMAVTVGVMVVAIYCVFGGNRGTAIVGAMQGLIGMVVVTILVAIAIHQSGGFIQLNTDLAAIDNNNVKLLGNLNLLQFFSFAFVYAVGFSGQPAIITKFYQITDSRLFPKTMFIGSIAYILSSLTPIVGMMMRIKEASGEISAIAVSDQVVVEFMQQYCGPFVIGLAVAACLAAIMSTGAANLITASSTMVNDVFEKMMHKDMNGNKGATYGKLVTATLLIFSGILALFPNSTLIEMGVAAWGGFAAVFTPCVVLGLRWHRATKQGAFWSMLVGLLLEVVFNVLRYAGIWAWPFSLSLEATSLIISFALMIIVSLATPRVEKDFMPLTLKELKGKRSSEQLIS